MSLMKFMIVLRLCFHFYEFFKIFYSYSIKSADVSSFIRWHSFTLPKTNESPSLHSYGVLRNCWDTHE